MSVVNVDNSELSIINSDLEMWAKYPWTKEFDLELKKESVELRKILEQIIPLAKRFEEITGLKITIDKGRLQKEN